MRSFVARILGFALVFGAMFAMVCLRWERAARQRERYRDALLADASRHDVVFFGDSHIAYGIDESVDARIANLATACEPYVLTGQKLRRVQPRKQPPEQVLGIDVPGLGGPVGFQNSATGPDLGFYVACSYSLMRPPRTGRRLIRSWERSATGWSGRGGCSWRLRWGRRPL